MARGCERCGGGLGPLRSGPSPRFCSTRCRVAAHRAKMPADLRSRARWVAWEPTRRAGEKVTKRPVQLDGRAASTTDPQTWTSYSRVLGRKRRGFVLGEGIGCIDLDHCLVNGKPTPAAQRFLDAVPDTYIEVSPSGDGLHVWGRLPEGPGSRRVVDGLNVEIYSVGRYITVTGQQFGTSVLLADLSHISA